MISKVFKKFKKFKKPIEVFKAIACILVSFSAGWLGGMHTAPAINTWYKFLTQPELAPPNWVFGPVWTILYFLIGIALYLVIKDGLKDQKVEIAVALFFCHYILNILWSYLFFGLQCINCALLEIFALIGVIVVMIVIFYQVNKTAGYLLIPYFIWTCFAAILNFLFYLLN